MNDQTPAKGKLPAHELVYRRIREMILFGELAPGQAVTIQGLVALLDSGITPVREAIRRLTAAGALEFKGNRRVVVPTLTLDELAQLSSARAHIEPELARQATGMATPEDIDHLEALDASLNVAISQGDVRAYLECNYRFHKALYALSEAHILIGLVDGLWLRVGPSLRVVLGRYGTYNLPDMHEEALAALRAGDAEAVGLAIAQDIEQGRSQIEQSLREG